MPFAVIASVKATSFGKGSFAALVKSDGELLYQGLILEGMSLINFSNAGSNWHAFSSQDLCHNASCDKIYFMWQFVFLVSISVLFLSCFDMYGN